MKVNLKTGSAIAMNKISSVTKIRFLVTAVLFLCHSVCYAVEEGEMSPGISLPLLSEGVAGETKGLNDYEGKLIYLDFWASWCAPCRKSLPILNDVRNKYSDRGFEVVAVNVDEDISDALKFLNRYPVDYPILLDPKGTMPAAYQLMVMPTSYLIDSSGVVVYKHIGFKKSDTDHLVTLIEQHLPE